MRNNAIDTIGYWAKNFFSFNTVIIAAITIGVIYVLSAGIYMAELNKNRVREKGSFVDELLWGVWLSIAMLFLQNTFVHLHDIVHNVDLGWQYSNAQFIILFYCLYVVHRKAVFLFNLLLPFYIYGLAIYRHETVVNGISILALVVLTIITYTVYRQDDRLAEDNKVHYYFTQLLFGLAWWIVISDAHNLRVIDIVCLTIEFFVSMTVINLGNKRVRELMNQYLTLVREVDTDALTGVYNRNSFNKVTDTVYKFYKDSDVPLTLVMFDIDHFKRFNDHYGHQTGDQILKSVAERFSYELVEQKAHGQLFRVGGEEFAVIFRGQTAEKCAKIVTDIRDALMDGPIKVNECDDSGITVSFGVAQLQPTDPDFHTLFNRVDGYLYQSKRNHRNSITIEGKVVSLSEHVAN